MEWVACANNSSAGSNCSTADTNVAFEYLVRIVIPIIFGLIALLGFVGNLSVIVVVVANKTMRNTTNILIIGLAAADLVFIVVCVPFTAAIYVIPRWPFGLVWCKVRTHSFGWGKGGNVTSAGWQVTLCDPIWHVSSRTGVATLRTAIHLLLTYLLPYIVLTSISCR